MTATLRRFKALAAMRSCPLFEHLLSPSLTNEIFQINTKQEVCMEEKYFQVRRIGFVRKCILSMVGLQ